jgi:hypothetical protein
MAKEKAKKRVNAVSKKDPVWHKKDSKSHVSFKHSYEKTTKISYEINNSIEYKKCDNSNAKKSNKSHNTSKPVSSSDYFETDIDGRSMLVKEKNIIFLSDGHVDLRSSAVRNGDVTINSDGTVRENCRAVTNRTLILK